MSGTRQSPGDIVFTPHAEIEILTGRVAGYRVYLWIQKVRATFEYFDAPSLTAMQACQCSGNHGLALARSGRGHHQRRTAADSRRQAHHSSPGIAFTPALNACFTMVMSVTVSAASTSSGGAARPVTMTCCMAGRACRSAMTVATSR